MTYLTDLRAVVASDEYANLHSLMADCATACADDDRLNVHVGAIASIMGRLVTVLDSMAEMTEDEAINPMPPAPEADPTQ